MIVTAGFAWLLDAFGLFTRDMIDRPRPNTGFIWHPDRMSFVVAFLAGVAGTLSLTSAKSGALIGVAISVTTVPAAANAAVAFSYGDYQADDRLGPAAPRQPRRHRPGGHADAAAPEGPVEAPAYAKAPGEHAGGLGGSVTDR
ncbi:hypothetical protein SCYAM73S_06876 [Streptomyces cyaneofuscatus]